MNYKKLDTEARKLAKEYVRLESHLLEIISQIHKTKAFYHLGYKSLFEYITGALEISPATAYNINGIVKKSCEVPQLKEKIQSGNLSISKAAKMTSVLTLENKDHWFQLAEQKTHRQLEREVALASPSLAVRERVQYIHPDLNIGEKVQVKTSVPRIALQLGLSEKLMLQLRRAQDLESSRLKTSVTLEETLKQVLEIYLEKRDPVKKAQRQLLKGKLKKIQKQKNRVPQVQKCQNQKNRLPHIQKGQNQKDILAHIQKGQNQKDRAAHILKYQKQVRKEILKNSSWEEKGKRSKVSARTIHRIQLRDHGQCTYKSSSGERCLEKRHLHIHHLQPVAKGGGNQLENLALVCSGHHKILHLM